MAESSQPTGARSVADLVFSFWHQSGLTPLTALTLFSFAVISMGGFMFSHSITIDDEQALFSGNPWDIAYQGRFLIGAYNAVAGGVLPFLPHLLLASAYVISYSLILACHGLSHNWRTNLAFLIYILFPVNWLNQEFSGLAGSLAIAMPLSCFAAYLSIRKAETSTVKAWWYRLSWPAIALLIIAISGYQSIVTLYLAICIGSLLFHATPGSLASHHHRSSPAPQRMKLGSLLLYGATALLASLGQLMLMKIFLSISNAEVQHINIYFRSPYFMLRTEPVRYLLGNGEQFLRTYLAPGFFYGTSLFALPLILIGACLATRTHRIPPSLANFETSQATNQFKLTRGWQGLFLLILLLATPLAFNIISTPYRIPMRALLALPYVAWFAVMIWLELTALNKTKRSQLLATFMASLLILQCLVAVSHYAAARAFNYRSDQLLAASIASAISQTAPQGGQKLQWLATDGFLRREVPYRTAWYSAAGASFFSWDNGSDARITAWLRAMGVQGLKPLEAATRSAHAQEFASMMPWPNPGSIRVQGDTVLIKFSEPER